MITLAKHLHNIEQVPDLSPTHIDKVKAPDVPGLDWRLPKRMRRHPSPEHPKEPPKPPAKRVYPPAPPINRDRPPPAWLTKRRAIPQRDPPAGKVSLLPADVSPKVT